MSANREALRAMQGREPVELGEGVTPERVVALALDVVDLGYRAHGENGRASLAAVQVDWMMQQWADAEERAAVASATTAPPDFRDALIDCLAERFNRLPGQCGGHADALIDGPLAGLIAERSRLLIAFHDAIRRPLGVTPDSGAEFYDPRMADEAEARRAGLKERGNA